MKKKKTIKKKKCQRCKEVELYYRNGVPVSKWCKTCKLEIEAEKKLKKQSTQKFQKARFKTLHREAWKHISLYVRQLGADDNGFNTCYTCEERKHYKDLQCGHFFHGKLDFDLRNLKPQCPKCNMYHSGNLAYYSVKLAKELGVKGMEQLRLDANTKTYTIEDLEQIKLQYKDKISKLKKD
jgi:hypothetical protein